MEFNSDLLIFIIFLMALLFLALVLARWDYKTRDTTQNRVAVWLREWNRKAVERENSQQE